MTGENPIISFGYGLISKKSPSTGEGVDLHIITLSWSTINLASRYRIPRISAKLREIVYLDASRDKHSCLWGKEFPKHINYTGKQE